MNVIDIFKSVTGLASKAVSLFNPMTWLIYGGIAAAVCLAAVTYRHHVYEQGVSAGQAQVQAKWNVEKNQYQAVALGAEQSHRLIETERRNHAVQIVAVVTAERQKTDAVRSSFAASDERLREQLARYASATGGSETSSDPDTLPLAQQRASTLGLLLATCRAEGKVDAGELEDAASQIRGLQSAYGSLQ